MLNCLAKACYFTKLNIVAVFNKIWVREEDEKYMTFHTQWELFEYLIMLFGVKNESEIFQQYINDMFHDFLDIFVTVYIDDILIYLFMISEHQKHVQMILEQLRDAELQCDILKCKFHISKVMYLSLIVSWNDIKMDLMKIDMIIGWESSWNIHDVWLFLEFANFYQWFIKNFLKIVWSLVNLTKKDTKFSWNMICEHVFNDLKKWFTTALILAHFDSDLEYVLEMNLSDHVQESVLLQYDKNGVLHPIAYFSRKLNAAESNYKIYNKKLLAIIQCFKQ